MTAFVQWLLRRRYALLILAIAVAPMVPMLAAALLTFETIRRGPYQGLVSAAIAGTGVLIIGVAVGTNVMFNTVGVATMLSGTALGAIVGATQSLALAFQASLLFCVACVVVAVLIWPDANTLIGPQLQAVLDVFRGNGAAPEQIEALSQLGDVFFGLSAAVVFAQLVVALFLGYWWACLVGAPGKFGADFRALKLGRILGVPATLVMAVSLFLDVRLVQNLFPLVLFGFCFQGLAVTHAWAHAKRWNPALLLVMYLLLVSPLTAIVILALSSIGLTDSWINLRAPLRTAT